MKRQWMTFVAVAALILSMSGAWWSSRRAHALEKKRDELKEEAKASAKRVDNQAREETDCRRISALAGEVVDCVEWESQMTNLLHWLGNAAIMERVRVSNIGVAKESGARGGPLKDLERQRFEVRVEGSYAPLVRYIERVERSPHAMVIEEFSMYASRNLGDHGEARLVISCLRPRPTSAEPKNVSGVDE